MMLGAAFRISTPPPLKVVAPLRTVNPVSTALRFSAVPNVTTGPARLPSMMVTAGPCSLATVIALPRKSMFSTYVPGATRTMSPGTAASIACWMVAASAGTRTVAASLGAAAHSPIAQVSTSAEIFMCRADLRLACQCPRGQVWTPTPIARDGIVCGNSVLSVSDASSLACGTRVFGEGLRNSDRDRLRVGERNVRRHGHDDAVLRERHEGRHHSAPQGTVVADEERLLAGDRDGLDVPAKPVSRLIT